MVLANVNELGPGCTSWEGVIPSAIIDEAPRCRVRTRHKSNKDGPQTDLHSQIDSQNIGPDSKELAKVIAAWPKLPAHLKKAVCS